MSALAQSNPLNTVNDSVTPISVNVRIDYILRFSKHAVLVVDEDAQACSSVGYQFIDQLSSEHNAAFVSASSKLNNIQMRCRIIEQLFSDRVFDPEQSLAVSLVNLLNAKPQQLAIVIDNAHFASLQIIHELTQLALIAKKSNLSIDVLLLGNYTAGKALSANKELFHKKLSVLSRQSGQLLSLTAKEFKTTQSWFTLTISKKWLIALLSLSLISFATLMWLQQQSFNFANLPEPKSSDVIAENADKTVLTVENKANQKVVLSDVINDEQPTATAEYINNVLLGHITIAKPPVYKAANVNDIVSAITAFEHTENIEATPNTVARSNAVATTTTTRPKVMSTSSNDTNVSYYQQYSEGFVIQIAGFTQNSILNEFLADYSSIAVKQYKRLLNNEAMTVVTSQYYATRIEAERALQQLPQTLLVREPWIKPISAINNEINTFESSQ